MAGSVANPVFGALPGANPGTLSPSANISGSNIGVAPAPGIGGGSNPFLPTPPGGSSVAPISSVASFPANTGGGTLPAPGSTGSPASFVPGANNPAIGGAGQPGTLYNALGGGQNLQGIIAGLKKTGVPAGIAALLAGFLQSGAGFNPQIGQQLEQALQPQIERGTENIVSQFSAMGNRFSSGAEIGVADFQSQVQEQMNQIMAQMYQQSVQNYLSVLMGVGKKTPGFMQTFGQSFASQLGQTLGGGGISVGFTP